MKILIDEQTPVQFTASIAAGIGPAHEVVHVHDLGWSGTKDVELLKRAGSKGFDLIITNDRDQVNDPAESRAIRRSGIHHLLYPRMGGKGLSGFTLTLAALLAALPAVLAAITDSDNQLFIRVKKISPRPVDRIHIRDLVRNPLPYAGR